MDAPNKINWDKLPPVLSGYKRGWCQCKQCGLVAYRDFIPYSLSNPVLALPCNHGLGLRFDQATKTITEEEARALTMVVADPYDDWRP